MNNSVFIKTMKNVRKYRDIQFVTFKAGNNHLVSKANYHTTKFFSENLAIEMRKTQKWDSHEYTCLSMSVNFRNKWISN